MPTATGANHPRTVQIVDTATALLRLTETGRAGDLLRGDDIRDTMACLRQHIDAIQQPKNATEYQSGGGKAPPRKRIGTSATVWSAHSYSGEQVFVLKSPQGRT